MAYDEDLADRVRALLGGRTEAERRMFGGLAFMVDGRMAVAANSRGNLMVKVSGDTSGLLAGDHVSAMVMGGRTMRQWVQVGPEALATDADLREWVDRGLASAG